MSDSKRPRTDLKRYFGWLTTRLRPPPAPPDSAMFSQVIQDTQVGLNQQLQALTLMMQNRRAPIHDRIEKLLQMDPQVRESQARLGVEYLRHAHQSAKTRKFILPTLVEAWEDLAEAYLAALREYAHHARLRQVNELLPLVLARAIHHQAMVIKWRLIRYLPVEPYVWRNLYIVYRASEKESVQRVRLALYSGDRVETTCEAEFVQALMLTLMRPSVLTPVEIELVDLWLDDWCRSILLEMEPNTARHEFFVDLSRASLPSRMVPDAAGTYHRFWGTGLFYAAVGVTVERLRDRKLGPEGPYAGMVTAEDCLSLVERVSSSWRRAGIRRREERKHCNRPARVYPGVSAIVRALVPARTDDQRGLPRGEPLAWALLDESTRGFGAMSQAEGQISPRVGTLLGIEEGGSGLTLAVVRRLNKTLGKTIHIGVERIANEVTLVRVAFPETARPGAIALLLSAEGETRDSTTLLVPADAYLAGAAVTVRTPGRQFRVQLRDVVERIENYVRVRYAVDGS